MTQSASSGVPRPDGLVLAPFRALRYASADALPDLLAPPYDVIDAAEQAELEARHPHNVVRLTLPRDDAGPDTRYAAAGRLLAEWRSDGTLRPDAEPALYVYEQHAHGHTQRGLVGAIGLTPAEDQIVLPHENTMAGPVADRLALMAATAADLEMIFLVYDGGGVASQVVADAGSAPPLVEASTPDGTRHRLWAITDPATLAAVAADLHPRRAVIADGHHRYATFLRYQADRHEAGDGAGPWDLGLAFLVDGSAFGPEVHAIHRAVPGLPPAQAAELARAGFTVEEITSGIDAATEALAKAGTTGTAFLLTDGVAAWLLTDPDPTRLAAAMPAERSDAWKALDVAVAHTLLIRELWQLDDTEQVVEFHHDVPAAVTAAGASGGTALLLNPTPVADVAAVAAAGDRMPRKSTLFVPKPATGLLIRAFADSE
ncbi:MAG TPA: DUF1015 domain-containing protein [Mycobacteriales bacterium]|jgi:uncharacterized protein (DUF1015 family)|nr:DUF1015 domain-containing protein [Mycobacteriales bacterium]